MSWLARLVTSSAPAATLLVRVIVGGVFLSEGLQKFLFPTLVGAGRFEQIGIPWPHVLAPFVGSVEISCGILVLLGLFTRLAVLPLIIVMLVAISSTKIPLLLAHGFWAMAHEARPDYAMLLGSIFLFLVGSGRWSLDEKVAQRLRARSALPQERETRLKTGSYERR